MSRDDSPVVRDVSPDEGYTYMHRAFLQAFMTRNVMTVDEVKPVLAAAMSAHSTLLAVSHDHVFPDSQT
jgi:flagellin-specific chaperone FliS